MRQIKISSYLLIAAILIFTVSEIVKADAVIFNGDYVKALKDKFKLNETAEILTGTDDPTAVAKDAHKGSLYLRQSTPGRLYVKQDDGSSTNWFDLGAPPTGTPGVFAGFNASGDLYEIPDWTFDTAAPHGATVQQTADMVDLEGYHQINTYRTTLNPTENVTSSSWLSEQHETSIGTGNGFNIEDVQGYQFNLNAREDTSARNATIVNINSDLGNGTDPISFENYSALSINSTLDVGSSITSGMTSIGVNAFTDTGSTVGYYNGFSLSGTVEDVTGGVQSITSTTNYPSVASYTGLNVGDTIGDISGGYTGLSFHSGVTGTVTSGTNVLSVNPQLNIINGGNGVSDSSQITTNNTGAWQSFLSGPTIGTTPSYSGFTIAPQITTVTNGYGVTDSANIDTADYYTSISSFPTIDLVNENYNGAVIGGTITGDGSGNAVGLQIGTSNYSNFATVKAIEAQGNVTIDGRLQAVGSYTPVDGGGLPGSVHQVVSTINVPASSTTANADTIGVNTAGLITLGNGSTITSGPFGLGLAAQGLPSVLKTETGSSADYITATLAAVSLDPTSSGGTVDYVNINRATILPQGGTHTLNHIRGFTFDMPFGDPGTDTWGIYIQDAPHNWVENNLKIGGAAGTTDTASETLEVEGNALLKNASGSQPQLKLSEDPDNGSSTVSIQSPASLSADYTLTLPDNDGSGNNPLITDGSGNTSWYGDLTLGVSLIEHNLPTELSIGGTIAGSAPLYMQTGSLLNTPEIGAIEFDGTYVYYTDGAATRYVLARDSGLIHNGGESGTGVTIGTITAHPMTIMADSVPLMFFDNSDASITNYGRTRFGSPSLGVPAISYSSDTDTGWDNPSDGNLMMVTNAFEAANVNTSEFKLGVGVDFSIQGSTSGKVTVLPPASFTDYTLTLPSDDGTPGQLLSTNGTGTLSWSSAGSGDIINGGNTTGATVTVGTNDAQSLALETNNVARSTISTSSITNTVPVLNASGSASAPSFSFSGDSNTGVYNSGADQLDFSAGGSQVASLNGSELRLESGTDLTFEGSTSGIVNIVAPSTITNYALNLPSSGGGTSNWMLNNAGNVEFTNTTTTGKFVDGSADEKQLRVQGHSTQTSDIVSVENSAGTSLMAVTNTAGTKIRGTTTNDDAASGFVGETAKVQRAYADRVGITTATATTIPLSPANLSLTAGHWQVCGSVGFLPAATTSVTSLAASVSLVNNTFSDISTASNPSGNEYSTYREMPATVFGAKIQTLDIPCFDVKISSTTNLYLVVFSSFTVSTMQSWGSLWATRVR